MRTEIVSVLKIQKQTNMDIANKAMGPLNNTNVSPYVLKGALKANL